MALSLDKDPFRYEEEKREFIDGLRQFHIGRGTPFDKIPWLGSREVDLYLLYQRVTSLGGWLKVTEEQRWEEIIYDFDIPRGCLNGEQALKYIYIRYLNLFEKINFLGEDPNHNDIGGERDAPARKKLCMPRYGVPLSYNYEQHKVSNTFRTGYNMSTEMVEISEYDKLEKALLSGLANEVDFVINVCTLLSNESKHTLRLDKSKHLLDLLLGHVGIFKEGAASLEPLYDGGWRPQSSRDFVRFWFDTVKDEKARKMVSYTKADPRKSMTGEDILFLGRDLGIKDKEGIRITQLAIILRNLSFDEENMKYLAGSSLVFRFLLLCVNSSYGTLRQLGLDTLGNLASGIVLEPADSFLSKHTFELLVTCLLSPDKFAVVRGLEMLSKLSQRDENEFVLSEKLDANVYEEITKYLTVQDIQLIVSSLEALYQLSELGEATSTKISEVSSAIDTLISLITVEAQSYGPNSLVGIKVVEYCPPPHLTGGSVEGTPSAPGPPASSAQPPGSVQAALKNKLQTAVSTQMQVADGKTQAVTSGITPSSDMETATCNWLQATYEITDGGMVSQLGLYSEYLNFCKRFSLPQALSAQSFFTTVNVVFPKAETISGVKDSGSKEMIVKGISKRAHSQPFSIPCPVGSRAARSVVSLSQSFPMRSSNSLTPNTSVTHTPMLLQRLSEPIQNKHQNSSSMFNSGGTTIQVTTMGSNSLAGKNSAAVQGTTIFTGSIPAQGYLSPIQASASTPGQITLSKSHQSKKPSHTSKKPQAILPRQSGQFPVIMPKTMATSVNQQMTTFQSNSMPVEGQIVYQTVVDGGKESTETKKIKTLLAKKLRQSNPVGIQGNFNLGEMMVSVDNAGVRQSQEDQLQIQYQTNTVFSQPQPLQQTTFIQYTRPMEGMQPNVQTIVNPGVQTFVMQPGMIVQQNFQTPSSSLQPTIIAQQPAITVAPQVVCTPIVSCNNNSSVQGTVVETGQLANCNQGASDPSQSLTNPSHSIPTTLEECVSALRDSEALDEELSQDSLAVCGAVEQARDVIQTGVEAHIERVENKGLNEPNDMKNTVESEPSIGVGSEPVPAIETKIEDSDISTVVDSTLEDQAAAQALLDNQSMDNLMEESNGSMDIVGESGTISLRDAISTCIGEQDDEEETGEMEDPAGMDPSLIQYIQPCEENEISKPMSPEEEPVMIENDGNELLFEQGYKCMKQQQEEPVLLNGGTEMDQLHQSDGILNHETEPESNNDQITNTNGPSMEEEDMASVAALVQSEVLNINEDSCQMELSMGDEGEALHIDTTALMAEQGKDDDSQEVIVPAPSAIQQHAIHIVENGFFEQDDLEARMAVENLLKDVEFNVNGDDACSEEDVAVYACPQSEDRNDNDSMDGMSCDDKDMQESRSVSSQSLNNKSSSSASLAKVHSSVNSSSSSSSLISTISCQANHVSQNGLVTSAVSHNRKPLMNGNPGSPEYCLSDRVPSPVYSNSRGNHGVKLVNGLDGYKSMGGKMADRVSKVNGVVNHKLSHLFENQVEEKMDVDSPSLESKAQGDILAQSILVNGIQPSDGDIPDSEPMISVVKQVPANTIIGNILTVNCLQVSMQGNLNNCNNTSNLSTVVSVPNCIAFTNNTLIASKVQFPGAAVCNSRHIPTPESSRDSELSCDSTASASTVGTDLNIIIPDKHSMPFISTPKVGTAKDSSKAVSSSESKSKAGEGKTSGSKSKPKKRNRSKSGGGGGDSKSSMSPSSSGPSTPAAPAVPEFMCEWSQCKKCFDNARSVFCHVCSVHLKVEYDGLCKWDGCEALVRKRWSLFTHVQDHHCSEGALRASSQRRVQALQSGKPVKNPAIPAMVYPPDAAVQAIRRFIPKPPYPEFMEGREGPVTKHIRLTAALILRNVARYSAAGRSLIKKHERQIGFSCMSAVESSTALANCLYEILNDR